MYGMLYRLSILYNETISHTTRSRQALDYQIQSNHHSLPIVRVAALLVADPPALVAVHV